MSFGTPIIAIDSVSLPMAAAAILTDEAGRYLLQHRDENPGIWYPGYWGLFGGAIEPGETPQDALQRELAEELELVPSELVYFTQVGFDLSLLGYGLKLRWIYEARLRPADIAAMVLHEGAEMRFFAAQELLRLPDVTPYDSLAVRLHINCHRLRSTPASERAPSAD